MNTRLYRLFTGNYASNTRSGSYTLHESLFKCVQMCVSNFYHSQDVGLSGVQLRLHGYQFFFYGGNMGTDVGRLSLGCVWIINLCRDLQRERTTENIGR